MFGMDGVKDVGLTGTVAFRLGVIGAVVTDRYQGRMAERDLKAKHVGLMQQLAGGGAASQLDVARAMGVAPSLVVSLADHLERLGAVERIRDPADRRRQSLRLTDDGRELLAGCTAVGREMEDELLAGLSAAERRSLHAALVRVAGNLGLPSFG